MKNCGICLIPEATPLKLLFDASSYENSNHAPQHTVALSNWLRTATSLAAKPLHVSGTKTLRGTQEISQQGLYSPMCTFRDMHVSSSC